MDDILKWFLSFGGKDNNGKNKKNEHEDFKPKKNDDELKSSEEKNKMELNPFFDLLNMVIKDKLFESLDNEFSDSNISSKSVEIKIDENGFVTEINNINGKETVKKYRLGDEDKSTEFFNPFIQSSKSNIIQKEANRTISDIKVFVNDKEVDFKKMDLNDFVLLTKLTSHFAKKYSFNCKNELRELYYDIDYWVKNRIDFQMDREDILMLMYTCNDICDEIIKDKETRSTDISKKFEKLSLDFFSDFKSYLKN